MQNVKLKIENAGESDLNIILEMYEELADLHNKIDSNYVPFKYLKSAFEKYLSEIIKDQKAMILIAKNEDKKIGFLIAEIKDRSKEDYQSIALHISDAFVLKEYRGHGILKKFIERAKDFAKINGIKRIELNVDSRNENAVIAYEKIGFEEFRKNMKMDLEE